MDFSLPLMLLQKILVLFIMIIMGFISVRWGKLKSSDSSVLSKLCFDWIIPCSLIAAFQKTAYDTEKMKAFLFAYAVTAVSIIFYIVITRLIQKPLKLTVAEQGTAIFSNSAGIGAPLVTQVLGEEQMFFCAPHMSLQNIFIFIYLPIIMSKDAKISWKKVLFNRNIIAIVFGIILFVTQWQMPTVIQSAVSTIGGMLSPVSMLMIGMLMGGVNFKELLGKPRLYLVSFARLLIYPLLFILLVKVTGATTWFSYAKEVIQVILICSSAPAAALVTQMAEVHRGEEEAQMAGSLNVITSLFCIITMPLLVWLYNIIC